MLLVAIRLSLKMSLSFCRFFDSSVDDRLPIIMLQVHENVFQSASIT